jgi:1-acyl-sn-glycerol-3-phosphate acyltransferase
MPEQTNSCPLADLLPVVNRPRPTTRTFREVVSKPLPSFDGAPLTRVACRSIVALFGHLIAEVRGLERIQTSHDPFILALNHSQRLEAVLVPAYLIFERGGRHIHFLADWNFRLVPLVSTLIRCNAPITVTRKDARPKFLNVFRRLYQKGLPPFEAAKQLLQAGASVGLFPEGTVNRHPRYLLKGYSGAARLSLSTGTPVVPVGIQFPRHPANKPVPDWAEMVLEIGLPMHPNSPKPTGEPALSDVRLWHARIMQEIARLARKEWLPQTRKLSYATN